MGHATSGSSQGDLFMNWTIRWIAATLLGTSTALAAQDPLPEFELRTGYPLPQSGIYFDPAQGGIGFSFDVGLDGTVMAGIGAYDTSGQPIFYTVQGRIARDALAPADAGIIGALRSPVYLSRRVGCADCPDARTITEPVAGLGEALVRFTEPRRLTLEIAGGRWNMQRMELTEDPWQWTQGGFLLLGAGETTGGQGSGVFARVNSGPEFTPPDIDNGPDDGCAGSLPQGAARLVTCEGDCGAFDAWAGGPQGTTRVLIWRDPGSSTVSLGRFRIEGSGLVRVARAPTYRLSPSPLSLEPMPVAQACSASAGKLRMYRDPAPLLRPPLSLGPVGPQADRDVFGSLRGGIWWNPARPGTGLVVDVGGRVSSPTVTAFVGVFDFRADGSAEFSTLQGPVRGPDQFSLSPNGLQSPLYRHQDGQCIGCPWRAPVTVADSAGLQLRFARRGNEAPMFVGPTDAGVGTIFARYSRFPLDRTLFDNAKGRWLLRVADPTVPAGDSGSAASEFYAEVVIESLAAELQRSALFRGSPAYAVRCTAACARFDAWTGATAVSAQAVLWFPQADTGDNTVTFDDTRATFAVLSRDGSILSATPASRSYALDLLPLHRYRTIGRGYVGTDSIGAPSAGQIEFFRNPPRVFVD
jgi:hypothetical protein